MKEKSETKLDLPGKENVDKRPDKKTYLSAITPTRAEKKLEKASKAPRVGIFWDKMTEEQKAEKKREKDKKTEQKRLAKEQKRLAKDTNWGWPRWGRQKKTKL